MSHFFARCASQKTHVDARIARVSRNVQKRAKKSDTLGQCLGSSTSERGRVTAQARAGKATAVDAAASKAARAGALCVCARTHTHSLTLPAKAKRAGALSCMRIY